MFPDGLSQHDDSTANFAPLVSSLLAVLQPMSAQDLLRVKMDGPRLSTQQLRGHACLGHLAVAPSKQAAQQGLSVEEETVSEAWTICSNCVHWLDVIYYEAYRGHGSDVRSP
eukprot:scaffold213068_cov19-Tisochrysis_lutea.AAC.1